MAVLIALAGCAPSGVRPDASRKEDPPARPAQATGPRSIRVATYNINYGNLALQSVASAIRQANADVVCLQETNDASASFLRGEFAQDFPHFKFSGDVSQYAAGGFGVLSRIPLIREEFVPAEHGLFGASVIEVQDADLRVQLVSVHLQPILLSKPKNLTGLLEVLAAFQAAETTHLQEISSILKHVRTDVPAVLLGDFNSGATFEAPKLSTQHGLIDSFAAVNAEPELHPTWRWPLKTGEISLRIDYIFHSTALRTTASRVIQSQGSDHWLVVSELEIVKAKAVPSE